MRHLNAIDRSRCGFLIPIGGGEDKTGEQRVLRRFVELCGGSRAGIAVIPTASERRDTGRGYERLFRDLGADSVRVIALRYRSDCDSRDYLDYLDRATGIFMTGGNQTRLSTILLGTRIARRILSRYAEGAHVVGTSAAAAFMPEHMIAGGESGTIPAPGMVEIEPGLGIGDGLMIDQHFRQRDRLAPLGSEPVGRNNRRALRRMSSATIVAAGHPWSGGHYRQAACPDSRFET